LKLIRKKLNLNGLYHQKEIQTVNLRGGQSGTGGLKAEEPKTHHKDRDIDGCAKALDQSKVSHLQNSILEFT
jgi:hypothetical protein